MKINTSWWLYSGVTGVMVLWIAMINAMRRAGLGLVDSRPLSYLGVNPSTRWIFSLGLLASSGLFIAFALHIKRLYVVKNRFLVCFLIGQAGQIIAAISPYGMKDGYRLIHTIAAYTLAFSLPLLIREFYHSQVSAKHYLIYRSLFLLEIITFVTGMGIFTMTQGIAPIGEALPAIGFHIWIICLTVLSVNFNKLPLKIKHHSSSHSSEE